MRFPKVLTCAALPLIAFVGSWSSAAFGQIEAANLQPLSEWEVEQQDDRCIVRRSFGDPSAPTIIEMRTINPWQFGYQTAVLSEQYSPTGEPFRSVWMPGGVVEDVDRFTIIRGDNDASGILTLLNMRAAGNEPRVVGRDGPFDVLAIDPSLSPADGPHFVETLEGLLLLGAFDTPLLIATGPMQGVLEEREPCIRRVLASHGVDPADADRDDYRLEMTNRLQLTEHIMRRVPRELQRQFRPANITFMLYVDSQAQPTSCRLASLPYDQEYEQRSCDILMRRAEFEFKEGEAEQPAFFNVSGFVAPWGCSGQMRCD